MQVGIIKERRPGESRVAITPDTVKKFLDLGLTVLIESKAGSSKTNRPGKQRQERIE
jgi:NAD(P) transhydrogenase subunit alpha